MFNSLCLLFLYSDPPPLPPSSFPRPASFLLCRFYVFIFCVQLEIGADESACVNDEAALPNATVPVGPLGTPREDLSDMEAKVGGMRRGACVSRFL